jgi:ribosomal protein L16 Arg81 hydroxylase
MKETVSSAELDSAAVSQHLVLSSLLAPLPSVRFLEEYWGKQPLYISGPRDKFRKLFSLQDFEECLGRADPKRVSVRASFDHGVTHLKPAPSEAMQFYSRGATLCVQGLETVESRLARTVFSIRRDLSFAGECDIRAYLSPDGQGFDTHFDKRIATTLQLEGKKRWKFSRETALDWPHYQLDPTQAYPPNCSVENWERCKPTSDCSFEEVVLEPGDVLCLPAGTWHSAEAIGYSFALNLAFGSIGLWGVLSPVLGSILLRQVEWRAPPPTVLAGDSEVRNLPESVNGYLEQRLTELIDTIELLRNTPEALRDTWLRFQEDAATRLQTEISPNPSATITTGVIS